MPTKKEMSLQQFPYNSVNPFVSTVIEHIQDSNSKKVAGVKWQHVINSDSGEVESQKMLVLGDVKKVDKQEFYKVYKTGLRKFFDLSPSSSEVLEYILDAIRYDSDKICLNIADIQAARSLGYTTVYRALTQLLEREIIAKADMQGCYYINPNVVFKGDRIALVKQFIKENDKMPKQLKNKNQTP